MELRLTMRQIRMQLILIIKYLVLLASLMVTARHWNGRREKLQRNRDLCICAFIAGGSIFIQLSTTTAAAAAHYRLYSLIVQFKSKRERWMWCHSWKCCLRSVTKSISGILRLIWSMCRSTDELIEWKCYRHSFMMCLQMFELGASTDVSATLHSVLECTNNVYILRISLAHSRPAAFFVARALSNSRDLLCGDH